MRRRQEQKMSRGERVFFHESVRGSPALSLSLFHRLQNERDKGGSRRDVHHEPQRESARRMPVTLNFPSSALDNGGRAEFEEARSFSFVIIVVWRDYHLTGKYTADREESATTMGRP